jgi:hypothetical protein
MTSSIDRVSSVRDAGLEVAVFKSDGGRQSPPSLECG